MGHTNNVEMSQTDQATFLHKLADDLRHVGLALRGLAHQEGSRGDPQFRTVTSLGGSLDRTADVLDAVARQLCVKCRMAEVVETLRLASGRGRVGK